VDETLSPKGRALASENTSVKHCPFYITRLIFLKTPKEHSDDPRPSIPFLGKFLEKLEKKIF
jgi:hypothetical protein